jgi:hypothetical protein
MQYPSMAVKTIYPIRPILECRTGAAAQILRGTAVIAYALAAKGWPKVNIAAQVIDFIMVRAEGITRH